MLENFTYQIRNQRRTLLASVMLPKSNMFLFNLPMFYSLDYFLNLNMWSISCQEIFQGERRLDCGILAKWRESTIASFWVKVGLGYPTWHMGWWELITRSQQSLRNFTPIGFETNREFQSPRCWVMKILGGDISCLKGIPMIHIILRTPCAIYVSLNRHFIGFLVLNINV